MYSFPNLEPVCIVGSSVNQKRTSWKQRKLGDLFVAKGKRYSHETPLCLCLEYGGYCAVGGGAFSGKDPSKVDRSASYMARKIAVDMVKKYGGTCSVQLAYAIGVAQPVSVSVVSSVAGILSDEVINSYDLTPKGIIKALDLLNRDYEKIAEGCHYREEL